VPNDANGITALHEGKIMMYMFRRGKIQLHIDGNIQALRPICVGNYSD